MNQHDVAQYLEHSKAVFILFMTVIGWPLLSAVLNRALKKGDPKKWEEWALKRPYTALIIDLLRAFGTDTTKATNSLQQFAERRAGVLPDNYVMANLPASVRDALKDPKRMDMLMTAARKIAETKVEETTPTVPPTPITPQLPEQADKN